jgi:protease IV
MFYFFRALLLNILGNLLLIPQTLLGLLRRRYYLRLTVEGKITERPPRSFWQRRKSCSIEDLRRLVERVESDNKVLGLVVDVRKLEVGAATLRSLIETLRPLKDGKKELVIHLEEGGMQDYLLGSTANRLFVPGGGFLDLRGMSLEMFFFGETLRRAGVELEVGQAGKFKSAAERFTRQSISPANKQALERLLEAIFDGWVTLISNNRGITAQDVRQRIDAGPYDAKQALEAGLIDEIRYADELESCLAPEGRKKVQFQNALRYLRRRRLRFHHFWPAKIIAVLSLKGTIAGGNKPGGNKRITDGPTRRALAALRRNRRVKAVVLEIDSPGGGVVPSDLIWREVKRLAEEKPTVTAMSNVAASGGYYIACASHAIVAQPDTITGSIGVIAGKMNISGLLRRLSAGHHAIRLGRRSGLFHIHKPLDTDEREALQTLLKRTYDAFLERVSEGRKMALDDVGELAQGRVWAGVDALKHGLVDRLGGTETAIELAKEKAGRKGSERWQTADVYLPRKPFSLLGRFAGAALTAHLPAGASELLDQLDPLLALERERALAILPFEARF